MERPGPKPSLRQTSRSRSRSRSQRRAPLQRMHSAQHFDDHSVYQSDIDEAERAQQLSIPAGHSDDESLHSSSEKDGDTEEYEETEAPMQDAGDEATHEKDVKVQPVLEKQTSRRSVKDPNLVTWDGPDDPQNPKNWAMRRKWAATFVVSSFTFISPVSSSMVAPALGAINSDLGISTAIVSQLVLSIFILAYTVGPLFLGPLSEVYGRTHVLQLSNLFYLVWNLACGFAQTPTQMLIFRFLSGLGGSAPLAIGGGVLSDCWRPEQRGRAISIYALAPLLGPAVGPIAGGFITENTTWRWVFWSTTIADALIQVSGLFFLQETYPPVLLHRKKCRLQKETGNQALHTEFENEKTLWNVLSTALQRPFRLLFTQPIIQVIAVYMAFLYGLLYLVLSTFPTLWSDVYHESIGIGGLNYISMGLGFTLATQITAPINDRIYRRLKKRNNNIGRPEFRIPLMMPASFLIPIGLFIYGWSAQYRTHWIVPNIGTTLISAGSIVCFQCMQTYIVDSYARYAASGVAAAVVLRSMAGFGFPLFAPYMYEALGYGWGNSLLGFVGIVIGIPAPFLFWKFGETLRNKSKFAAGGD